MKYTFDDAASFEKSGVELHEYVGDGDLDQADVLHVTVDGHHETEFVHEESAFVYYVLDGEGTFHLDGEPKEVTETDVVAIPPNTKVWYEGEMELLLVTAPLVDRRGRAPGAGGARARVSECPPTTAVRTHDTDGQAVCDWDSPKTAPRGTESDPTHGRSVRRSPI